MESQWKKKQQQQVQAKQSTEEQEHVKGAGRQSHGQAQPQNESTSVSSSKQHTFQVQGDLTFSQHHSQEEEQEKIPAESSEKGSACDDHVPFESFRVQSPVYQPNTQQNSEESSIVNFEASGHQRNAEDDLEELLAADQYLDPKGPKRSFTIVQTSYGFGRTMINFDDVKVTIQDNVTKQSYYSVLLEEAKACATPETLAKIERYIGGEDADSEEEAQPKERRRSSKPHDKKPKVKGSTHKRTLKEPRSVPDALRLMHMNTIEHEQSDESMTSQTSKLSSARSQSERMRRVNQLKSDKYRNETNSQQTESKEQEEEKEAKRPARVARKRKNASYGAVSYYKSQEIIPHLTNANGFFSYKGVPDAAVFIPEQVDFNAIFFHGCQAQDGNTCVIHAVNSLAGCWFYQSKEQFVRVYFNRMHMTEEKANDLVKKEGLRLTRCAKILADGRFVYSLTQIHQWTAEQVKDGVSSQAYITDDLLKMGVTRCIMGVEGVADGVRYRHANTWKWAVETGWVLLDHAMSTVKMQNPIMGGTRSEKQKMTLKLKRYFTDVLSVKVFILKSEPLSQEQVLAETELLKKKILGLEVGYQRSSSSLSRKNKKRNRGQFKSLKKSASVSSLIQNKPLEEDDWEISGQEPGERDTSNVEMESVRNEIQDGGNCQMENEPSHEEMSMENEIEPKNDAAMW